MAVPAQRLRADYEQDVESCFSVVCRRANPLLGAFAGSFRSGVPSPTFAVARRQLVAESSAAA